MVVEFETKPTIYEADPREYYDKVKEIFVGK
jgi:hypothetical protein